MSSVGYAPVAAPEWYVSAGSLKIHPTLAKVVEEKVVPNTGFSATYFWKCMEQVVDELRPELEACLARRDELQRQIDGFYERSRAAGTDMNSESMLAASKKFLHEIGYLEPDQGPVSIATQFVDPEIASIPAPQLVVPSDNARYVLNAVNARWGSLYDAIYGFDVIPATAMTKEEASSEGYNAARGDAVIEFANHLLDEITPLATGEWSEVVRLWPKFVGDRQQLELLLADGRTTSLRTPSLFVGAVGTLGPPRKTSQHGSVTQSTPSQPDKGRIFLKHNGLHLALEVDRDHPVGKAALSGIKDITVEAALTAILDMEDSVSAVDAEDKAKIYANIAGVLRGTLEAPYVKDGKAMVRRAAQDVWFRDQKGEACSIPGRALLLVRNVGHHMFSDMVITADGKPVPEGFVDCLVTVACALQDLNGQAQLVNSRCGSVYIVKPKMHGPREVALTCSLFGRAEECFGLRRNTIKMGIMDEERRTSANLRECLRVAAERVFFINTGFLDRTGDEIHTCMRAGAVVRKGDMRSQLWIKAYEDQNVDIGLFSGFQGKGQIGKGMWAKPDSMKGMLEAKIAEPMAGASTAWVPSPSAAALHSIHYHRVDVPTRQMQLAMRPPRKMEHLLTPPLVDAKPSPEALRHELRENAQSTLGYVVRWVDLGVGCSKVPDLQNVGLMEDRATLRISSQLLSNWLLHGFVTEVELREAFKEMAAIVDQQNSRDRAYRPMATNVDSNIAFQAALKLVLDGQTTPNGYTEFILHEARRKAKAVVGSRL